MSSLVKVAALATTFLASTATADPWPKRGLAANDDIPIGQFGGTWEGAASQVNWQYNWASDTTNKQSFMEYVPMLWDASSTSTASWDSNVAKWLGSGSGHLLSFNEPDLDTQANMSPSDAASAYLQWMTPYHGSAQLGSPAITNAGTDWLQSFLSECSNCEIDFIAAHWYDQATNFAYFESYVNQLCSIANGKQVWITEFQGYGTIDEESSFLDQAIPFLDGLDCIYRYAYFATADPEKDFLENGGPSLSPLGVQFTFSAY